MLGLIGFVIRADKMYDVFSVSAIPFLHLIYNIMRLSHLFFLFCLFVYRIPAGSVYSKPVSHVDMFATAAVVSDHY